MDNFGIGSVFDDKSKTSAVPGIFRFREACADLLRMLALAVADPLEEVKSMISEGTDFSNKVC